MLSKNLKLLVIVFLGLFLIAGCSDVQTNEPNSEQNDNQNNENTNNQVNLANVKFVEDGLNKLNSKEELVYLILENQKNSLLNSIEPSMNARVQSFDGGMELAQNDMAMVKSASAESFGGSSSGGATTTDYSTTNNQVKGVDEADIMKNDNKYIYTLSNNKVVILNAYPAKEMEILSKIEFDKEFYASNIFIYKDQLIVLGTEYKRIVKVDSNTLLPRDSYEDTTQALIYDIKDRTKPTLEKDYTLSGNYYDARLIGDYIYFISTQSVNNYQGISYPFAYDMTTKIMPEVYYFGHFDNSGQYHNIGAIGLEDNKFNSESYILNYGSTLFVSQNNIYIAYKQYNPSYGIEWFKEVVYPNLNSQIKSKIEPHLNDENSVKISKILEEYFNSKNEEELETFQENIQDDFYSYEAKIREERDKTQIFKFSIDKEKIELVGKQKVKGYLLNQFSLDEFDENLRVATTISYYNPKEGEWTRNNNVYVLDKDMKQIGSLEGLAPNEEIKSARFMGEKLYLVTFERIDPLFVIDLKDPSNPNVLGELKIPGYSTYLHPIDDKTLLGIGFDTKENDWGGISNDGVKLAIFDVSDVKNPKEVDVYKFEGQWTNSIALHEHKAFLFDKEKELLVIPMTQYTPKSDSKDDYYYDYKYEQNAQVLKVTTTDIQLKGKIVHKYDEEGYGYYYWRTPNAIKRSLFMDDTLYTISENTVKANNIDDLEEIETVELETYDKDFHPNYPYYY